MLLLRRRRGGCFVTVAPWYLTFVSILFLHAYLFQQTVGVSPLVDHVDHIPDVNANAAREVGVEVDVGRQAVPVAVESEADELPLAVEHWRAAVAARDVVVGKEAEVKRMAHGVSVLAEVVGRHERAHYRLGLVVDHSLVAFRHLVEQALRGGVVSLVGAQGERLHLPLRRWQMFVHLPLL